MNKEINKTGKIEETVEKGKYLLKQLCGRPSPAKRLVSVLFLCVLFGAANIYFLVCAFSGIGKNENEKELIKLEHIEPLELPKKESIHDLKSLEYDE